MIINQTENTVISLSNDKHMKFGIDEGNFSLVYKSFLNYSNPIGSIVREITSNCFDSHIEAGIDKPVRILWRDEDRLSGVPASISFIDEGVGMSEERVENVYCKFFTSTKRDTNTQIGGFGIGAKTPLSYVDMFSVITVSEGTEYHYSVHKGVSSPEMTLMSKVETDKPNGTEIRINVKSSDKALFFSEIEKQLKYFDNVQVENFGARDQSKTIHLGKNFVFSEGVGGGYYHTEMDLCIGKVRYPIDRMVFNNLTFRQRQGLNTPVGLRFEIGEISVTWNRESLEYTEESKNKIIERLEEAMMEMEDIFKKQSKKPESVRELVEAAQNNEIKIGNTAVVLSWLDSRAKTPQLTIEGFDFEKSDVGNLINQYLVSRDSISKSRQKTIISLSYSRKLEMRGYLFESNERLTEKMKWILSKRNNVPHTAWKYADLSKTSFDHPSDFEFEVMKMVRDNPSIEKEIREDAKKAFDKFLKLVIEYTDEEIERLVKEGNVVKIKNVTFSQAEEDAFAAAKLGKKKKVNDEMRIEYHVMYYNSKIIRPSQVLTLAKRDGKRIMIVDIFENREIANDIRQLLLSQGIGAAYMCVGKSRVLDVLSEEPHGLTMMTCEQFSKSKLLRRIRQRIRDHVEKQEWEDRYRQIIDEVCYQGFEVRGAPPGHLVRDLGNGLEPNPEIRRFYEKMMGERIIEKRRHVLLYWNPKKLDAFFGKDSKMRTMIDTLQSELELLPKYNPKYEYRRFEARVRLDSAEIGDDPQQ